MNNRKIVVIWEFIVHFPNISTLRLNNTLICYRFKNNFYHVRYPRSLKSLEQAARDKFVYKMESNLNNIS